MCVYVHVYVCSAFVFSLLAADEKQYQGNSSTCIVLGSWSFILYFK
jgi:hypothetical protein